jgi:hypothetical protein
VIDGKLSLLEAQSRLDDMIDAITLQASAGAVRETASVVVSQHTMTEHATDP